MTENDELQQLRHAVRDVLTDRSSEADVRRAMLSAEGFDRNLWTTLAGQLGLHGLLISEQHGGSAAGYVELGVVLEEMGAALLCAPFLATAVLAVSALMASADASAMAELLPAIASGELIATVAHLDEVETVATRTGAGFTLSGAKGFVLDGAAAGVILTTARTAAGLSMFVCHTGTSRVTVSSLTTMDLTRRQARITFDAAPARLLGTDGAGEMILRRVQQSACVALAHESLGGAERCLSSAVDHARQRYAFGRPIGSFQAIKHRCADMLVDVEAAKSVARHAARVADSDPEALPVAAALAKVVCADAFHRVAASNIQVHGGIGFTWEHPAHLYFKRAKTTQLMFGDSYHHRRVLADLLQL